MQKSNIYTAREKPKAMQLQQPGRERDKERERGAEREIDRLRE